MTPQEYLLNHSLSEEFVLQRGWELSNDTITIPIFDADGKFIYNKYRHLSGDSKFTADQGSHPALYCAEHIKTCNAVVLAEGEPDTIRLWQEGIPAVTGTFGVATFSEKIAQPLQGKTVYITLDTDTAGQAGIDKYIEVLQAVNAKPLIVQLPPTFKDVSEFLTANSKKSFKELLSNALTPEQYTINKYSSQYPILDNSTFINTVYPPTKWLIDKLIRVGGISFLVGEAGTGKTIASLSMVKSISEGKPWLDKFPSAKSRVLILDKENTPSDIQKLFMSMGIKNENVYNFFQDEDYQLMDDKANLTPVAKYLSLFVKEHHIDVVILDSAIDFLVGSENESGDVAININKWREIFAPASIIAIHHESKQDPRAKRKAADRMRGSSVWLSSAQSVLSFSVMSLDKPDKLMVEHSKVRGGKKLKPFQIDMIIRPDPFHKDETIVDGYKWIKEIEEIKLKHEEAAEAIVKFLRDRPDSEFSKQELIEEMKLLNLGGRNVSEAITQLEKDGDIYISSGTGKRDDPRCYKINVDSIINDILNN